MADQNDPSGPAGQRPRNARIPTVTTSSQQTIKLRHKVSPSRRSLAQVGPVPPPNPPPKRDFPIMGESGADTLKRVKDAMPPVEAKAETVLAASDPVASDPPLPTLGAVVEAPPLPSSAPTAEAMPEQRQQPAGVTPEEVVAVEALGEKIRKSSEGVAQVRRREDERRNNVTPNKQTPLPPRQSGRLSEPLSPTPMNKHPVPTWLKALVAVLALTLFFLLGLWVAPGMVSRKGDAAARPMDAALLEKVKAAYPGSGGPPNAWHWPADVNKIGLWPDDPTKPGIDCGGRCVPSALAEDGTLLRDVRNCTIYLPPSPSR